MKGLLQSGLLNGWLIGLLVCLVAMWMPLFVVATNPAVLPWWASFSLAIGGAAGAAFCGYRYTES